ncbi:CASP8-associated protein 2 [Triplophysa rosa]|uniref:CASP8-associated protein 2 n=1 Tax=Triplophysa rosa TaxID=992332 RepID=A0A9W7TPP7_TRIRA|nr:CASP8-associated protein 2 [Triplophysa rosa]XP_057209681.1 CASP8-associated protein 2 [Triplophysa rosa]XP_057209682.1 CASP8-associated protein 2 [Triplophysa rosa]KAI7800286.1 CASP8-associated protein 2 [Triplophysa rosa]
MEDRLMDELYGDLDNHPYAMCRHDEEDSVDIYCGLESSPKGDKNKRKVNHFLSPRTIESMDMYEELIREEQEEKEATYNELKQKFEDAQLQVKELISKLQLLQTKNSSLNNENTLLKKNICSLIKTARMEIVRKDEEISRLSNRSGRGCYGQIFHQSPMEMGQVNTRHTLNNTSHFVLERRDSRQDRATNEVNKPKGRNTVLDKATASALAPQPFVVLQRCPRNDLENPLNRQNKNSAGRSDSETILPKQEHGRVDHNKTSDGAKHPTTSKVVDASNTRKPHNAESTVPSTTSDSLGSLEDNKNCPSRQVDILEKSQTNTSRDKKCNLLDKDTTQKGQKKVESNSGKSGRIEGELIKDSSVSSETTNHPPEVPVILKSSGRSKSPSTQSHKALSSDGSSQSSKSSLQTAADMETQNQEHIQDTGRPSKETRQSGWRRTITSLVDEATHSHNNKMEKRDSSGQQRKEEKRQATSSSVEGRSNRTERHREHEKRPKESGRTKRDESHSRDRERKSNRSEGSKEHERRSAKEADKNEENKKCREGRSKKQADTLDTRHSSSPKCDSQEKDVCKGQASSRINESLLNSKRSHGHDSSRKKVFCSPDKKASSEKYCAREKVMHKDRERKRDSGCEEHTVQKDGKSKNAVHNKDQKDSLHKKDRVIREGQQCKDDQNKHLKTIHTKSPSTVAISSNSSKTKEDNSPDQKLSFMETLNLTLSPLKKQRSSSDLKKHVGATAEDASADNGRISELSGEEILVIDNLQNSQQSVEEINEVSEPTTIIKQHDRTSSSKLFMVVTSEKSSAEETNMEVQEQQVVDNQEAVDEVPPIDPVPVKKTDKTLDINVLDKDSSKLNTAKLTQNRISQGCTKDSTGTIDNPVVSNSLSTEMLQKLTVSDSTPYSIVNCQKQNFITTVSEETSLMGIQSVPLPNSQDSLPAQNRICQENVSSSDRACNHSSEVIEGSVTMEVSSSTKSVDLDEQITVICYAAEMSTSKQDNERSSHTPKNLKPVEMFQTSDNLKMTEKSHQSSAASITVREETTSSTQASFSEPDSTEKDEQNIKSSSSDVLCHDEDSMMLTLRNIKVIPEAISPLTSPVRQVKRVQPHCADKQPHVKSLSKDLSTASDKVNMDMNKENKSPDSSVTTVPQMGTVDALSVSGTEEEELEDGEIVSESEEEGPLFIQTPPREQDKSTSGSLSSPKLSSVGKRASQEKSCAPVKYSNPKSSVTPPSSTSPTSNKRRFKTVSLPLVAAVLTLDEFMDRLANIRVKLRRKYMKLHKNVTSTAFCCIVDMSQASFTEFVNAVDLDKLCHQGNNMKGKLNKIITSIMSKVTKNGIVNRIFDQKAGDLKLKLWTFVDGQFDFLFKELKAALRNSFEPSVNARSTEDKNATLKGKEVVEKDHETSVHRAKKAKVDTGNCSKETPPIKLPPPRGLGSRGKNIKAVMQEDDEPTNMKTSQQLPTSSSVKSVLKMSVLESTSGFENKISPCVRSLSNNGLTHDKSDFDILTEQQASSLTYNLVSDCQMGEIFKCLLQGSDLLEPGLPVGDSQCWPVSTPRKEDVPGDSLIGIMTPNKTTPSKFSASWSSISPYKFSSNSKMLVDPAILDESCLLEVPSSSKPSRLPTQSTVTSQRTFSILAEDLAVSLTIPSPLKSESHLSFLHPGTGQPLSAPNSIMSAHYSEDALDGEDPTEQDIHLSLDTDNSSCGSSPDRKWEDSDPTGFQFKPNLPMQAVVMEKSNDHFIVRIRHTSTSPTESGQNEEKMEPVLTAEQQPALNPNHCPCHKDLDHTHEETVDEILEMSLESCHISDKPIDAHPSSQKSPSEDVCDSKAKQVSSDALLEVSSAEVKTTEERVSRKRKKHHSEPTAKRTKTDKSQDKHRKARHKRMSKSPKDSSPKGAVSPVSSSSLSAKNVIKKKGEVVATWTRDEDRDILVELKMKGASPKTFAALSKRLKKSTEQIEERFTQLLKLFKKKEKMEN